VSAWPLIALAIAAALAAALWRAARRVTVFYPPQVGLLYRNGRFVRELPPGRHVHLDLGATTRIVPVSLAEVPVTLGETTVLSKDQFSFRLALAPVLAVTDARAYAESQPAPPHALAQLLPATTHPALQPLVAAAALEAAAARTLAELLAGQRGFLDALVASLADAIPGARIERVLLTGINLPPETRKMFTDVERARFEAQAVLERARGEQAALRLLANSARMMADSPALGTLRLLQAIETSKGATTIVMGKVDGVDLGASPTARG
jgi:regulator of protease activity HflC (stomatin/prohibitin superfamily)